MAKKKTKVETPVDYNEIEILTWDQINELFDVNEKQVRKFLTNGNNTENYWYPYETGFSEEQTTEIVKMFRNKFLDITILDKHGAKYAEITLGNVDKHQYMFSLIKHFKK